MNPSLPSGPTGASDTAVTYEQDGSPLIEESRIELHVSEGVDLEQSAELGDQALVIGTGPDCGFRLKDPSVSRRHVELTPLEEGIRVRDMKSTNGTMIGGNRITEAVVQLGAVLVLGKTKVEIIRVVERHPLALSRRRRLGDLIGSSAPIRQIYALLERAADADVTVLVEGETGTGKELAARAIHQHSTRSQNRFQIVDCGAVSPTLIEAELFGHVRGAFTGADRERPGAFELAHQGTLFFDEIGELPLALQPKLLRALESREVRRIGGSATIPIDVRFVAATNRNLADEVKRGRFREDLYYRLNVFRVVMPPLREHRDDIPILVKHFLEPLGGTQLSAGILDRMTQLDWPGNVRELRNAVERAVVLARGERTSRTEPPADANPGESTGAAPIDAKRPFKELKAEVVSTFERSYLEQVLDRTRGNISAAAREAGIDRKHMERLIRKHGIEPKQR